MRVIVILNLLIVVTVPLATAQNYFPNITELLEGMHQYQQQRIISYFENYGYHHIEYLKVYYNARNKLVKPVNIYLKAYTTWTRYFEYCCFLFNSNG